MTESVELPPKPRKKAKSILVPPDTGDPNEAWEAFELDLEDKIRSGTVSANDPKVAECKGAIRVHKELVALEAVSLQRVMNPSDIWTGPPIHIDGVNRTIFDEVMRYFQQCKKGLPKHNVALQGSRGTGKSHLLGWLNREITRGGDLFVLVDLNQTDQFWESLVQSYLDALNRRGEHGREQYEVVVSALIERLDLSAGHRDAIAHGQFFSEILQRVRASAQYQLGVSPTDRKTSDVVISLLLRNSSDDNARFSAISLLQGMRFAPNELRDLCIRSTELSPRDVIRALHRIFAFCGLSTMVAFDQMDWLNTGPGVSDPRVNLHRFTNDMMDFTADCARKDALALVALSCLPTTWDRLVRQLLPMAQRFSYQPTLKRLPSAEIGEQLIAAYLGRAYERVGFQPPYPTWPIKPSAFASSTDLTARQIIIATDNKIRDMRLKGAVSEIDDLMGDPPVPPPPDTPSGDYSSIQRRFQRYRQQVQVPELDSGDKLDEALPPLLYAGLKAFSIEAGNAEDIKVDEPSPRSPMPLHARLRRVIDPETEVDEHWSFRAIVEGHPRATLTRLNNAITQSALGVRRSLIVLRNEAWPGGKKNNEAFDAFKNKGGRVAPLAGDDLKTFAALRKLFAEQPLGLEGWLVQERPAGKTGLLSQIDLKADAVDQKGKLSEDKSSGGDSAVSGEKTPDKRPPTPTPVPDVDEPVPDDAIPLGRNMATGRPVSVKLEMLRRHTVIFAGSGSGKTVLIRRMIEECALKGVSAIVLDPNNDLSRLGLPWPDGEAPTPWSEDDRAKAKAYHEGTEVLVWTPRVSRGRPLSFRALPDFTALKDDKDAFDTAITNTVETLSPLAGLPPRNRTRTLNQAVFKEALIGFVEAGGTELQDFIGYLTGLPEDASLIADAPKLAADMGQSLLAATVMDPLLSGEGALGDPGPLLTPAKGKKARISVISLVGLPTQEQQQNFVAQLQMDLFSWFKKNPAKDKPLGGLLVMDEAQIFAASSGAQSACLETTLMLSSQARKFGLGLIFATQAPRGLHNRIPGNATTQFYGRITVPAQIEAARDAAAAKGGNVDDIGQLTVGQYYAASEGVDQQKIRTPMCLSYHPPTALTQEDIVDLARGKGR